jgi:hypothetical protein
MSRSIGGPIGSSSHEKGEAMSRSFFSQFGRSQRSKQVGRRIHRRRQAGRSLGSANLAVERLEDRLMLAASDPGFHIGTAVGGGTDIVDEGTPYTVYFSFDRPPNLADVDKYTIDWKDGTVDTIFDPNATSATHTYSKAFRFDTDNNIESNSYFPDAAIVFNDGTDWHNEPLPGFSQTLILSVNDVAFPVIAGDSSVNEGSTYTLNLSHTDPGTEPPLEWIISWNSEVEGTGPDSDPNPGEVVDIIPGNPSSVTHVYTDGGTHTILAAYADATDTGDLAGAFLANTLDVNVNNVAPTAVLANDGPANEGSTANVSFSGQTDPSADDTAAGFHYAYDFNNDGTWDSGDGSYGGSAASASAVVPGSYLVDGPGVAHVKARIIDKDGGFTDYTTDVVVNNVAPTLTLSGAANTNEGATYTLGLSSSDPGADTISSWTIHWGDSVQTVSGNPSSVAHVYSDGDANYAITATATDEDGTYAAGNSVAVTVHNLPPTANAGGSYSVNEGGTVILHGTGTDPAGAADPLTFAWDLDNNGTFETTGANPVFSAAGLDGPTVKTVKLQVSDGDGGVTTDTATINVLNVAPTASAGGPYSTFDDTAITLTGTATDPAGALDPLTYAWDLDNNGTFETSGATATFNPVALGLHGAQTRTVSLRVSDGDGGVTTVATTVQILGTGTTLSGGTLFVVGSNSGSNNGSDVVTVGLSGGKIQVFSNVNNNSTLQFNASDVHSIQISARGGNDVVTIASNVTVPATIDGGAGDDVLIGGGGPTVIFGGTGNDVIVGGTSTNILDGGDGNDVVVGNSGRDLVIGGKGTDVVTGGSGDDIVIGGYTSYDSNQAALQQIMAIWNSSASFSDRVASLTGTGGLLRSGTTVFDDDATDVLSGGDGRDLYFADNNNHDGVVDIVGLQATLDALVAVT